MKKITCILLIVCLAFYGCQNDVKSNVDTKTNESKNQKKLDINLDLNEANRLAQLPLDCIQNPLPYKSGLVIAKAEDLKMPQEHHPAFYGCFDWHSAVHGHWSLIYLNETVS